MKKIICIGGSDSSQGAGIELDSRILLNLSAYFETIATAFTFQGHHEFISANFVDPEILRKKIIDSLPEESCIVKIGMLGNIPNMKVIYEVLSIRKDFIIFDPLLYSSSGGELFELKGIPLLKEFFFSIVDLLTPNYLEMGRLLQGATDPKSFFDFGVKNVLLKGGHIENDSEIINDYFFSKDESFQISVKKINRKITTRGTGCALASSIAYGLAKGLDLKDSIIFGKINLTRNFRNARLEKNVYVIYPQRPFQDEIAVEDMPSINSSNRPFKDLQICGTGVYPIVDKAENLRKLKGVKIAQLRVKNLTGSDLEKEIEFAIQLSHQLGINLFINDYLDLALKYKAFGVHLGQEDLERVNLEHFTRADIRLGISTHSYYELAKALGYGPSYIAFGPIYFTTLKAMNFPPQGISKLKVIRKLTSLPLVAIGGITLDRLQELENLPEFVAVVSDIFNNQDPATRVQQWLKALT